MMQTTHSTLSFAGHRLHVIDFDPLSVEDRDLLWLPHASRLASAGRKRKAEHLAGRIAAVHALREFGHKAVPGVGERRQPLWPAGLFGSISHCETTALAVVSALPVGADIEAIFTPAQARELESRIITAADRPVLEQSGLPAALALTLAFSARESAFKAAPLRQQEGMGFTDFQLVAMRSDALVLRSDTAAYQVSWRRCAGKVITLAVTGEADGAASR